MTTPTVSAYSDTAPSPSDGGANNRLIRRLKISGMLSFGPQGIDLSMEPLNVLIGPNGSGKSNFIEALALLQAAPRDLSAPVKRMGGISEWLWKGDDAPGTATIDVEVATPDEEMPLRHVLEFTEHGRRFEVVDERIENAQAYPNRPDVYFYYRFQKGSPVINDNLGEILELRPNTIRPQESILSQRTDPDHYPKLHWLQKKYGSIRLYRNWEFGPDARLRQSPMADQPSTFLTERGENLALMLSNLRDDSLRAFVKSLQQLYDGIEDFKIEVRGGQVHLFVVERGAGERYVPASRLSDGTLRYMALAAILLDPEPPPLVVIEEPELGMHPDVVLGIGEMLIKASEQTQLVVTTHSRVLVDALSDYPSSVVVCEKYDGESEFERLEPKYLTKWLEEYSLGKLWSTGEIRGNRW